MRFIKDFDAFIHTMFMALFCYGVSLHVSVAANPDLLTLIGVNDAGTAYGYISNDGSDKYKATTYGLTENGTFIVDYGSRGKTKGRSQCSSQTGTNDNWTWNNPTVSNTLPETAGKYCYCQLDTYIPTSGASQDINMPWLFINNFTTTSGCKYSCADSCGDYLKNNTSSGIAFRTAVFNTVANTVVCNMGFSVPANSTECVANTINLNWYSVGDTVYETSTCTYDEQITLPETDPTRPGYVFSGWRLRTSQGE